VERVKRIEYEKTNVTKKDFEAFFQSKILKGKGE